MGNLPYEFAVRTNKPNDIKLIEYDNHIENNQQDHAEQQVRHGGNPNSFSVTHVPHNINVNQMYSETQFTNTGSRNFFKRQKNSLLNFPQSSLTKAPISGPLRQQGRNLSTAMLVQNQSISSKGVAGTQETKDH